MKKIVAILAFLISSLVVSAQDCNTVISKVSLKPKYVNSQGWCITVNANKLSNGLYPYFAEFQYKTKSGTDTTYFVRAGFVGYTNQMKCKAFFPNIKDSSYLTVRTINFTFNRLWGTNDPNSQYYNPYYGKSDQQIYAEIKDDSTKWCQGNTIIVP